MARFRLPGGGRPRRDRRRSRGDRDPGSLSPVMGKAAACATVLVYVWCIFMVLATVHFTHRLETGTLAAFVRMHDAWGLAALLMLVFVGTDLIGRVTAFRTRGRALLAVDVFTIVVLTMMLVANLQFSNLYARMH